MSLKCSTAPSVPDQFITNRVIRARSSVQLAPRSRFRRNPQKHQSTLLRFPRHTTGCPQKIRGRYFDSWQVQWAKIAKMEFVSRADCQSLLGCRPSYGPNNLAKSESRSSVRPDLSPPRSCRANLSVPRRLHCSA